MVKVNRKRTLLGLLNLQIIFNLAAISQRIKPKELRIYQIDQVYIYLAIKQIEDQHLFIQLDCHCPQVHLIKNFNIFRNKNRSQKFS